MSTYVLPQVQVFQIFNQLPSSVIKNLNAFVFGGQYQLFRYGIAAEKPLTELGAYDPTVDTVYAWPNQPAGSAVDTGYVQLYADNVLAQYAEILPENQAQVPDANHRNEIRVDNMVLKTANGYTRSGTLLRNVQVGDRVRYSYTDGSEVVYTGSSKIEALLADIEPTVIGDATPKASNHITQAGTTDLDTGNPAPFAAAATNTGMFSDSTVFALDPDIHNFTGSLTAGVESDVITVEITVGGAAGTAEASVSYASGLYNRSNVSIDASGASDGVIYLGNNLYLQFAAYPYEPQVFSIGDLYTVTIAAPFTKLDDSDMTAAGVYTGIKNTTYQVQVLRGGVFDRSVRTTPSLDNSISSTMELVVEPASPAAPSWNSWLGGDNDDEYILTCTTGGAIAAAKFELTSQRGDDAIAISFGSSTTEVALGNRGLFGAMTGTGTFTIGDYWAIRVNACRAQIRVTDSAGIDAATVLTVTHGIDYDIGNYGVTINFNANGNGDGDFVTSGGLLLGDVYYVAVACAYESAVKTIMLADDVVAGIPASTSMTVWLYLTQNAVNITSARVQAAPDYNWTADVDGGITVFQQMQVQDPSWHDGDDIHPWLDVYSADLYAQYRALMATNAANIQFISDVSLVVATLGTIHPDNPLAQGVYNALLNSGNQGVYYIALPSNTVEGWSYVLNQASLTTNTYAFCPLTRDINIIDLVVGHINGMSTPTQKSWRIAFIGMDMPTSKVIYSHLSNPTEQEYFCTVSANPTTGKFTVLNFVNEDGTPSTITKCLTEVKVGDNIVTTFSTDPWGAMSSTTYRVASIATNNKLNLVAGPATAADEPAKVEVWHPYTVQEIAEAVAARSSNFYNRRIYNCFPPALSLAGVTQTAEFGAAAIAGLVSSVPPQQPLTNIQLMGFDDLPLVYRSFTRDQLNIMAGGGTLIIMQDTAGGEVYVRHQVSTATSSGDMNQTELSITKNLDSISYYFAVRFAPYIGRYNVTAGILSLVYGILNDGINYLGSLTSVGLLGPQIILTNTEIVGVQQNPIAADTIIATVNLGLPAPFNVLQLQLVV